MRSPIKCLSTTLVATWLSALGFQAIAADVEPIFLPGSPSKEVVARLCSFPNVEDKRGVASPVEVEISEPENGIYSPEELGDIFKVEISLQGEVFSFADRSEDPDPRSGTNSQFFGIQGTEAVVAESSGAANIYCNLNAIAGGNLCAPSEDENADSATKSNCTKPLPLTKIRVFWVFGPSGFEGPDELEAACESVKADFFIAHRAMADAPVNFNGCNGLVPRFCQPPIDPGAQQAGTSVVRCEFTEILTDATALGSCGGSSGGSRIRC